MQERLIILYETSIVGYLTESKPHIGDSYTFQYSPEWLIHANAFAISLSLPLQQEAFHTNISYAFFDNLLPEENARKSIASENGIVSTNSFALLKQLASDCAGALSIISENETREVNSEYTPLDSKSLASLIQNKFKNTQGEGYVQRLSLAGAQSKTGIMISPQPNNKISYSLPINSSSSNYILKFPSQEFQDITQNEAFCMGLAHYMGLVVSPFFLTKTMPMAFIIQRYDRILDISNQQKTVITKIHQEDFCQALGITKDQKYQRKDKGSANLKKCFEILKSCKNPEQEKEKLLIWVLFNFLIGNADAHAKNISLIYDDKKPSLAPFYDLLSTAPYKSISPNLSFKIGEKNNPKYITKTQWEKFSQSIGITYKDLLKIYKPFTVKMYQSIDECVDSFVGQYAILPDTKILETIKERCEFVLEEWTK